MSIAVMVLLGASPAAGAASNGSIAGKVTAAVGGAAIGGVEVCAFPQTVVEGDGPGGPAPVGETTSPCTTTEASGKYTIGGLSAGAYEVDFRSPDGSGLDYLPQVFPEADSYVEAEPVTVNGTSARTGIDAELRVGAELSGRVKDATTEAGLGEIRVCAIGSIREGCAETAADGTYTIAGLASGGYKVSFWPGQANYIDQYYNGKSNYESAQTVQVSGTSPITGIDARLQRGATISGTVVGADTHQPLDEVSACALISNGNQQYICGETDATGSYAIHGLPAGEYQLWVQPTECTAQGAGECAGKEYATQFTTVPVVVTAGGTAGGVDLELQPGGKIDGAITNAATDAPLAGVSACAFGTSSTATPERCGFSAGGTYSIKGLSSGEYKVEFISSSENNYYNGASSLESAQTVTVHAGGSTSGIDGRLLQGAEIYGVVTDAAGGAPVEGIEVCATSTAGGFGGCATTNATGAYTIANVSGGEYKVEFAEPFFGQQGPNFQPQYYPGTTEFANATPVVVGPHERRGAVNAQLHKGGLIEGVVKSGATGEPIAGVDVCAYGQASPFVDSCTQTGPAGEYRVAGLPAGPYGVWFGHERYNLVSQYYEEGTSGYPGKIVNVTVGSATTGINVTLKAGAEIAGTVTSEATGETLSGVSVNASPRAGGVGFESTSTGTDGRYLLKGLRSTEYTVEFNASQGEYTRQFYKQRNQNESPDPVAVSAGSKAAGIDAALTRPAPVEISPPTISGTAHEGRTLTEAHGEWTNEPTSFEYRWLRCDAVGGFCSQIAGAQQQAYTLGEADAGHAIEVQEIAADKGGETFSAPSEPTAVVVPEPPVNIVPPEIGGTAQQGQELFEEAGEWRHEVRESEYRWLRCDATGSNCAPIAGAEAEMYEPVGADVGHRLRVRETAINAGGASQPASSEPTAVVVPPVPTKIAPPTISGTARQSDSLTEAHGTWTNAPTSFEYQWSRCDAAGNGCATIPGAQGAEYVPVGADVGHRLRVSESAVNAGGASEPSASAPTTVVLPSPPAEISPPALFGTAQQGQTLSGEAGSWTNEPSSYEYRWLRCDTEGEACAPIVGAEAIEYVPVAGDVGHRLRFRETAVNAGGPGDPAASEATVVVVPPVPTNEAPPTIAGTAEQSLTLTVAHGRWTNAPTSFGYRWLRCDAEGNGCEPIDGATERSYVPVAADIGQTIEVEETAINAGGAGAPALSPRTAKVQPAAPVNTSPPTIVGEAQNGLTLIEQNGSWTNEPTAYRYQWLRCDGGGDECNPIAGAVDPTYRLIGADIGQTVEVEEIGIDAAGPSEPATSAAAGPVTPVPLEVSAGDNVTTTVGAPVHFDATGSGPAGEIDRYQWQFGDGAEVEAISPSHTYATTGTYTATLTVSRGDEQASAAVTVEVEPLPTHEALIAVTTKGGAPLGRATVLYIGPGGERIEGESDGGGTAHLAGLPEGVDAVYAYADGYQPAVGHVTVTAGGGEATVALSSGALGASTIDSHEMTLEEIEAAGIDVNDPANENVFEFEVRLAFLPEPQEEAWLHCYINENGEFVGTCLGGGAGGGDGGEGGGGWGGWGDGDDGSGGGAACSPHQCVGDGIVVQPSIVHGHPVIQWLILRGKAAVLKQFFEVTEVVQNLSPQPFEFAPGTATLSVPAGMSLAPTAAAQAATQQVPAIAGEGSAEINWIVRGDRTGSYPLSSEYRSTLEPLAVPVELEARLATPLRVWGAEALELTVEAEEGLLAEGQPYRVKVHLTNKADVPLDNVLLEIFADVHAQFIFQPAQGFAESIPELKPGETISTPMDILVPDAESEFPFNPNQSSVHFVGEEIHPGQGISTLPAVTHYALVATNESASQRVQLNWARDPEAEGYEVFSTSTLDTPFPGHPESVSEERGGPKVTVLPENATAAYAPYDSNDPDKYYAVTSIVHGVPTLDHTLALASTGSGAEDWGYCFEAGASVFYGAGTADGTVCVARSGDGSQAYVMAHGDAQFAAPPPLNGLANVLHDFANTCAAQVSGSIGAIAFEGPADEDPGLQHYATVNGSIGVGTPIIHLGVGVNGALMQSRNQSTFGLYYAYGASFGVGCIPLPVTVTADAEPDYSYHSTTLTGAAADAVIDMLNSERLGFETKCAAGMLAACSLAAAPDVGPKAIKLVKDDFAGLYLNASQATQAPGPPSGVVDWNEATSDKNTGFTSTASGPLTVTAKGIGAFGVGSYGGPPAGVPALRVGTGYFDVKVSDKSIFGSVIINDCDLGDADTVQWLDPKTNTWQDVSDAVFSDGPSSRCVEITVGQDTSPSLSQLTGTVFGVSPPAPACAASPTVGGQPGDASVTAPAVATFSVAEGSAPAGCSAARIQWQRSTDGGSSWSPVAGSQFSGATSSVLRIGPTAASESGGRFRAVLSNAHGDTDSSAATLTVAAEATGPSPGGSGPEPTGPQTGSGTGSQGGSQVGAATGSAGSKGAVAGAGAQPAPPNKKTLVCKKGWKKKKKKVGKKVRCVKPKRTAKKAKGPH
jgi:PKD domain/Carboxypeptidase regulatory-like domain